jgi:hypothetical protein
MGMFILFDVGTGATYLQGGVTFPWTSPMVLAPLLSAFVVVAIFCLWEWKGARLPIVPSA